MEPSGAAWMASSRRSASVLVYQWKGSRASREATSIRRGYPGMSMRHPASSVRCQCSRLKRYRAIRSSSSRITSIGQKVRAESTISPRHCA